MKDIIYFSDIFYPTFPKLEINLVSQLRGIANVKFCMFDDDPRLKGFQLEYKNLDIIPVASPKHVAKVVSKGSLYVSRFDYGKYAAGRAARLSKQKGAWVFMHDVAGIDMAVRRSHADFVSTKSKWMSEVVSKRFKRAYKRIFITGTIHFDDVVLPLNVKKFRRKYKIPKGKKILLLTPANPGESNSQKGIEKDYQAIVHIVEGLPEFQVMIKGHPFDYSNKYKNSKAIIRKVTKYGDKSSWDVFAKKYNVPICLPEDGYNAIKVCDAVLNIRSSLALEVPMFYKPVINVNRNKYVTNWVYDPNIMIDVKLGGLRSLLRKGKYSVSKKKCNEYVAKHCYSNDGKAYRRITKAIEKIL